MTKKEALEILHSGKALEVNFKGESFFEVRVYLRGYCDFSRRRQWEHDQIGPVHIRFWGDGGVHWIHISEQQLDAFLDRNFSH